MARTSSPAGPRGGLSPTSLRWLEAGDPARRKARGQYLTPRPVAEALVDRLKLEPGWRVLDPGVGTGELLRAVLDREPGLRAAGWDIDASAVEMARRLVPEADLEVRSALRRGSGPGSSTGTEAPGAAAEGGFDLVLANPPYFQLKLSKRDRARFAGVISGRANVFALFFQIGLELLRPGGTLAYIVPPTMNSGAYFEALREYLVARAEIRDLTVLEGTDWFEGANTAVQLLVLTKKQAERHPGFVFRREAPEAGFRRILLSPDPGRLAAEFEGRRTLWELGLEASTGQVIWNQNRARLVGKAAPGRVPLVWSHSIGPGRWRSGPDRAGKPGFYDTRDGGRAPLIGPAIVVNRVVGAVGRGELRAALIPAGQEFLAENHVNVIRPRDPSVSPVDWDSVLSALRQPDVAGRIRLLTGNTQISATELTHLLPLDE